MKIASMKIARMLAARWLFLGILIVVLSWVSGWPTPAQAQSAGNNAVWNSTGVTGSWAFIDATPFYTQDICATINYILAHNYPPTGTVGAVIDARGISPGQEQLCSINPFSRPSGGAVPGPSVVLLPASTIDVEAPWILPNNTKVVGAGQATVLAACNGQGQCTGNFSGGTDIIDMGGPVVGPSVCPAIVCQGVAVEHLKVDANGLALNGIVNGFSQQSSYVNDVYLHDIGATTSSGPIIAGLTIGPDGGDSGPYSNIYFTANGLCGSGYTCQPTACVQISAQTRGLHGISCIGASSTTTGEAGQAAIHLDANSNTLDDVYVEGWYDGVVVGDSATTGGTVSGNTLRNITGHAGGQNHPLQNSLVHICDPGYHYGNGQLSACTYGNWSVRDVSIFGAASNNAGHSGVSTIVDDLTGTTINDSQYTTFAGMYILGGEVPSTTPPQYSRFTTSPGVNDAGQCSSSNPCGVPTWGAGSVGSNGLGTGGTSCSLPGVVFSNTAGTNTSNVTVYVCTYPQSGSGLVWWPIA
jgi:hypothetical protein